MRPLPPGLPGRLFLVVEGREVPAGEVVAFAPGAVCLELRVRVELPGARASGTLRAQAELRAGGEVEVVVPLGALGGAMPTASGAPLAPSVGLG